MRAIAVAMLAWAAQYSGPAGADLYRWVDPESGSIKFSSYPPPWYGDPARERRAPKVEVIPERGTAPSSGPKPDEEARQEGKPAAKPALKPETAAMKERAADKERPADGR
jgi:hypothetical protein